MSTALLSVQKLSSGYGASAVLRDVSFDIAKGEIFVVLGKNGMGKSTLVKTIMGFVRPTGGTVLFNSKVVTGVQPHLMSRLGVAHAPQEHTLFTDLSVEDNLKLGVPTDQLFQKRLGAIELVFPRMLERLKQRAGTLSGGEQKMLLMSRALIAEPKLMLIDEISEGLQPAMVDRMSETLVKIRDELNIAVILVEQNLNFALSIANRYAVLKLGEIVDHGVADSHTSVKRLSGHLMI
jgi:branched-chain amino acid transport system ATP-binding protein